MKNPSPEPMGNLHPIQLVRLGVKELFIRANVPPDTERGTNPVECLVEVGTTSYDTDQKIIGVSLRLELGTNENDTEAPYAMRVELVGFFQVDEDRFPMEQLSHWTEHNAPLILYPFVREHAFGLSSRCGFRPLLLPLLEVPTFKIEKPPRRKKKTPVD